MTTLKNILFGIALMAALSVAAMGQNQDPKKPPPKDPRETPKVEPKEKPPPKDPKPKDDKPKKPEFALIVRIEELGSISV